MRNLLRVGAVLTLSGAFYLGATAERAEAGGELPTTHPTGRVENKRQEELHRDAHRREVERRETERREAERREHHGVVTHETFNHREGVAGNRVAVGGNHVNVGGNQVNVGGSVINVAGVGQVTVTTPRVANKLAGNLYVLSAEVDCKLLAAKKHDPDTKEAGQVARALQEHGIYQHVYSHVLTGDRANRANILAGLRWLEKSMTERDVAVIFLSSHGGYGGNSYGLMPAHYDANSKNPTMVWGEEVRESLYRMKGHKVCLIETCQSAGILSSPVQLRPVTKTLLMSSCTTKESSGAAMGYAAVRGLSGEAATAQGVVTSESLCRYLHRAVLKDTQSKQHPMSRVDPEMKPVPLSRK